MPPLSSADRSALLALARQSMISAVVHQRIPDLALPTGPLAAPGGAFVTLFCKSRLRGCVGRTDCTLALAETVAQCAIGAALHDPRFPPITSDEIDAIQIEVSVLSALQPISLGAIRPGMHGLVVSRGSARGLLLPQVASEHSWSAERFLEETSRKAGLDPKAWRDPGTNLQAFTVEIIAESDSQRG
jgi:AmmeMemoRadiSam system protein A